jgi:hypothetical protein
MITATHTHSGPSGYLQYAMYAVPDGIVYDNFNILVKGIAKVG